MCSCCPQSLTTLARTQVIYYDKFFQRVRANLPKEVSSTAALLFARCYEYRSEIRDELECVTSIR